MIERFQNHMLTAADEFLRGEGIKPDWINYFRHFSTDATQMAREIVCYAGNCWPEAIERGSLEVKA